MTNCGRFFGVLLNFSDTRNICISLPTEMISPLEQEIWPGEPESTTLCERPCGEIYIISEALLLWWQQMNWTHKTTPSGLKRYIQICISVHECPWFFRHERSLLKALRNLYWQKPEGINGSQTARCINHKLGSAPVQVVSRSVWRVFVFFITLRSEHFGSCRRTGLKGAIRIVWGSCGVVESLMTKPHQQEI